MADKSASIKDLQLQASQIRRDIITTLNQAGSGHAAGALGLADVFTALYFAVLNYDPQKPNWPDRDRLVLSCGHYCVGQYVAMAHAGYFPKQELKTLRKLGTRLQGHPSRLDLPGIETSSGPLGQGTSQAVGMALAAKLDQKNYHVYCLTSDGEQNEGQTWEAVMLAAKYKLNNLTFVLDQNKIQIDGFTKDIMPLDSLEKKYQAFNWQTIVIDGHDFAQILKAFQTAKASTDKPTVIICQTIPGKGVSFMENQFQWHGKAPDDQETQKALKELSS